MNTFTITIEVDDATPLTGDDVDRITDELAAFSPALSNSVRGFRSVTISVPGGNLRQAFDSAFSIVEDAMQAAPIVCEVLTEAEADVRQGWADVPELVSVKQAAELLGVTRQRVLQRIGDHTLPGTQVGREYVIPRSALAISSELGHG